MRLPAGSHGVGKALDGELAQLVPQAGLTSAQTDTVIPAGTAPSLAARVRRKPKSAAAPRHHDWDLHEEMIVVLYSKGKTGRFRPAFEENVLPLDGIEVKAGPKRSSNTRRRPP